MREGNGVGCGGGGEDASEGGIDKGFHWDEVTTFIKLQRYKMNQQNKIQN